MTSFDSFRAARWLRTLNLVLQAVLFLTFFLGLNYLARNHAQAWRFDLTHHHRYSLSPETLSYVQQLLQPVTITVTVTDDNDNPEVRGLLKEYENATEGRPAGKITVRYLDPYQDRRKAEELGVEVAGVVLLQCGGRPRAVPVGELYTMKGKERDSFIGEQKITSALLEVSDPDPKRIYFLGGHGELRPDDVDRARGLSLITGELRIRNFKVEPLDLSVARKIPANASLVVVTWPQSRFTAAEQEMLRQYLVTNAGRIILFLAPGIPVTSLGLDDLLLDWGVLVDDDLIWDTGANNMTDDGDLIIGAWDPTHPITQTLKTTYTLHLGATRSVRPDPGRSLGNGLNTVTLAATSETAWGEVGYRLGQLPRSGNPGNIHPIPGIEPKNRLGVAVASERVAVGNNLPLSVRGGRLVVIGSGDPIANGRVTIAGNQLLFLNAVNWAVERDRQLNVRARPIERFQLSLSAGELARLRYALFLVLPGIAATLGLIVYWTRRS